MKISTRLAGGLGAAALATTALIAAPAAMTATGSAAHAADSNMTTVNLTVKGGNGMTVTPYSVVQSSPGGDLAHSWKGKATVVKNGKVSFTIPTDYTDGMSLQVQAPWESGNPGYVPMATLSSDSFCYPGTQKDTVNMTLKVQKKTVEGLGGKAVVPNVYKVKVGSPDSVPGHQDLPYCTMQ